MQQKVARWESGAGGSAAGRQAQDWAAAAMGRRSTAATAGSRAVGGAAVLLRQHSRQVELSVQARGSRNVCGDARGGGSRAPAWV